MAAGNARPNQPATLRLVDASGGLNTAIAPSLLSDREARVANNVSYDQKGTISPRRGRRKRYTVAFSSSPVVNLGAYYKKDGTARLLMAAGNSMYYDKPHQATKYDTQAEWQAPGSLTWNDLKNSGLTWGGLI